MQKIIKNHYIAFALAILAGILYILPQVIFIADQGDDFAGVQMLNSSDEHHYLATVEEVRQGHLSHSNTYLYEYKDDPMLVWEYSELLSGVAGNILDIPASRLFVVMKFIFGAIVFLVVYALGLALSGSKTAGILASSAILLAPNLVGFWSDPGTLLFDRLIFRGPDTAFISFSRLLNPLFTFVPFFLGILSAYRLFEKRSVKWAVINGLLIAVNIYMYVFFWIFLFMINGITMGWLVIKKEWHGLRLFAISISLGVLLGSKLLYDLAHQLVFVNKEGEETLFVAVKSRKPIFDMFVFGAVVVQGIVIAVKRYRGIIVEKKDIFLIILLLGALVASNQQVLTGMLFQQHHFYFYTNIPMALLAYSIVGAGMLGAAFKTRPFTRKSITAVIVCALFFFGAGVQGSSYRNTYALFADNQKYGKVFDWLNANSEAESVVFANEQISSLLPIYTKNNVYGVSIASAYTTTPMDRRKHTFFALYSMSDRGGSVPEGFERRRSDIGNWLFTGGYYQDLCGSEACFPDKVLVDLVDEYVKFRKIPIRENFKKYRIDYFLWDKKKDPDWSLDGLDFLREVYSRDQVVLYVVE